MMTGQGLLALLLCLPGTLLAETSNRLIAGVQSQVTVGGDVELFCAVADEDDKWTKCSFASPEEGVIYSVLTSGGGIQGSPQGVTDLSDERECRIRVEPLSEEMLGKWACTVESDASPETYQRAFLNVILESRVSDVRIPQGLVPVSYDVALVPHLDTDFSLSGAVSVALTVRAESTSQIYLHSKATTIYEDTVEVTADDLLLTIEGFGYDADREFFIVYTTEMMTSGQTVELKMSFLGEVADDLAGFYRSSYVENGETKYLAATQFQSTDARKAFPCMDEPALKAIFNIKLGRKEDGYRTASNMPMVKNGVDPVPGEPGYVWDEFQPTEKMSTYLVAFLVSDYDFTEGGSDDVPFRIWSRRDVLEQTHYAAQIGPQVLSYYEDYFGIPFPLPKQDMVALTDLSFGGMENWGLITYREGYLLYEEDVTSLQNRDSIDNVVAHELAHMWFGDLVTMEWWSDLWLNEGFAEYTSYIGAEHISPDFRRLSRFLLYNNHAAYDLDAYESSHPINVEVGHPDEINEIFDNISYEKGSSLIRMMSAFLTQENFMTGIKSYLNNNAYGNAVQDVLWEELSVAAGSALPEYLDVKTIMDTWTLKKGFPLVSVSKLSDTEFAIWQKRFLLGEQTDMVTNYWWWVPVSYTTVGGDFEDTSTRIWLEDSNRAHLVTRDLPRDEDEILIFNVQGVGYYRVTYDDDTWLAIAAALGQSPSDVHVTNRAVLLNDALNVARAGELSYDVALAQTVYLDKEDEYVPWASASSALSYTTLMLSRTEAAADAGDYIVQKTEHLFNNVGYDSLPSDSFDDILIRDLALSYLCGYDYPQCADRAVDDFSIWANSPAPDLTGANPIESGVRKIAYCTAIRLGQRDDWEFLYARFVATDNGGEKSTILWALGCSHDPQILTEYLNMLMTSPDIRKGDALTAVSSVSSNIVGADLAWNWLSSQWDEILAYYDTAVSSPVARMVESVTKGFNTQEQLDDLISFRATNAGNLGTAERAVNSAVDSTTANVAWMDAHYDEVALWFAQNRSANDARVISSSLSLMQLVVAAIATSCQVLRLQ